MLPNGWTRKVYGNKKDPWPYFKHDFPAVAAHLLQFSEAAKKRCDKGEFWWELRTCDYYDAFENNKILFPDISIRGNFILDIQGHYTANTTYFLPSADPCLLAILNSFLMTYFYKASYAVFRGGYLRFFEQYLRELPIATCSDAKSHEKIASLADQMHRLHKRLQTANTDHDRTILQRQITATDKQIDNLVYKLYGLTKEEIAIVEANA